MLKRTLKTLWHLLQDLEFMFDHLCLTSFCFWTLSIKVSSFVFCLPLTLVFVITAAASNRINLLKKTPL